jgi:hypothetical protein
MFIPYASSHKCEPNLSIVERVSSPDGWLMVYVDLATFDYHRHCYCDWRTLRVFHSHLLLENGLNYICLYDIIFGDLSCYLLCKGV